MGQEYFKDKYAVELIRDTFNKRSVTMLFQIYHKDLDDRFKRS